MLSHKRQRPLSVRHRWVPDLLERVRNGTLRVGDVLGRCVVCSPVREDESEEDAIRKERLNITVRMTSTRSFASSSEHGPQAMCDRIITVACTFQSVPLGVPSEADSMPILESRTRQLSLYGRTDRGSEPRESMCGHALSVFLEARYSSCVPADVDVPCSR